MVFRSEKELKDYLMSRCEAALVDMQIKIHELIHEYIKRFYAEYSPKIYHRLYQLYDSLVVSEIEQTANGFRAVVYFDPDMMNHTRSLWTEEEILETALIGDYPHGGYIGAGGTGIWFGAQDELQNRSEIFAHFKQYLIENGIPVK